LRRIAKIDIDTRRDLFYKIEHNVMARGDELGTLEQVVLLALLHLEGEGHGMKVRREIAERTGKNVSIGAVYATLDRLEEKKLLASRWAPPTAERGGRSRRVYHIEPAGRRAIERSQQLLQKLLEGLPALSRRP
jgi:PadR family transcriptional regulator, regulatory protein PadR